MTKMRLLLGIILLFSISLANAETWKLERVIVNDFGKVTIDTDEQPDFKPEGLLTLKENKLDLWLRFCYDSGCSEVIRLLQDDTILHANDSTVIIEDGLEIQILNFEPLIISIHTLFTGTQILTFSRVD